MSSTRIKSPFSATHYNTLQQTYIHLSSSSSATRCNKLQHATTHYNTLPLRHTNKMCRAPFLFDPDYRRSGGEGMTAQEGGRNNKRERERERARDQEREQVRGENRGWRTGGGGGYGVASISRLLKNICLFCKRALQKRPIYCKETYDFKEPTNRSHPIRGGSGNQKI